MILEVEIWRKKLSPSKGLKIMYKNQKMSRWKNAWFSGLKGTLKVFEDERRTRVMITYHYEVRIWRLKISADLLSLQTHLMLDLDSYDEKTS